MNKGTFSFNLSESYGSKVEKKKNIIMEDTIFLLVITLIWINLLQAFAKMNTKLEPLLNGCEQNRQSWVHLSNQKSKNQQDEYDRENHNKDAQEEAGLISGDRKSSAGNRKSGSRSRSTSGSE